MESKENVLVNNNVYMFTKSIYLFTYMFTSKQNRTQAFVSVCLQNCNQVYINRRVVYKKISVVNIFENAKTCIERKPFMYYLKRRP